jgi:glycine cleavage system transcriptional repressor
MSILRGHFAMMLLVAAPESLTADQLEAALGATAGDFDLVLAVRAIDDTVPIPLQGETWTVSVYGADRPGIVHEVTRVLAEAGANVVDLTTRVIGEEDRPLYAMLLDVTLPPGVDGTTVQAALDQLAASLGVDCSMHPADADVL